MAIALVQATQGVSTSNPNPFNVTYTSATTTGNLFVAVIQCDVITINSVTDNLGNTWTLYRSIINYTGSWSQYIFYCANATGGVSDIVSVNTSATGWDVYAAIHEFSGAATSSPIEQATATVSTVSAASSSLPTNGAPITTTNANDYVMGIFDATTTTTYSAATGWALLTTGTAFSTFATVGSAEILATSYTPQILSAITGWNEKTWSLAIIAGSGATARATNHNLIMLGVGT